MDGNNGGVRVLNGSHRIVSQEAASGKLDLAKVLGPPEFSPMEHHIEPPPLDLGASCDVVSLKLEAGSAMVMSPGTFFGLGPNLTDKDALAVQLLLMADGLTGPALPAAQHSWVAKWKGTQLLESPSPLVDEHLFPLM